MRHLSRLQIVSKLRGMALKIGGCIGGNRSAAGLCVVGAVYLAGFFVPGNSLTEATPPMPGNVVLDQRKVVVPSEISSTLAGVPNLSGQGDVSVFENVVGFLASIPSEMQTMSDKCADEKADDADDCDAHVFAMWLPIFVTIISR